MSRASVRQWSFTSHWVMKFGLNRLLLKRSTRYAKTAYKLTVKDTRQFTYVKRDSVEFKRSSLSFLSAAPTVSLRFF